MQYGIRDRRVQLGLCAECGKQLDEDDELYCKQCNEKFNDNAYKNKIQRRLRDNLCVCCGKEKDRKGVYCSECWNKPSRGRMKGEG